MSPFLHRAACCCDQWGGDFAARLRLVYTSPAGYPTSIIRARSRHTKISDLACPSGVTGSLFPMTYSRTGMLYGATADMPLNTLTLSGLKTNIFTAGSGLVEMSTNGTYTKDYGALETGSGIVYGACVGETYWIPFAYNYKAYSGDIGQWRIGAYKCINGVWSEEIILAIPNEYPTDYKHLLSAIGQWSSTTADFFVMLYNSNKFMAYHVKLTASGGSASIIQPAVTCTNAASYSAVWQTTAPARGLDGSVYAFVNYPIMSGSLIASLSMKLMEISPSGTITYHDQNWTDTTVPITDPASIVNGRGYGKLVKRKNGDLLRLFAPLTSNTSTEATYTWLLKQWNTSTLAWDHIETFGTYTYTYSNSRYTGNTDAFVGIDLSDNAWFVLKVVSAYHYPTGLVLAALHDQDGNNLTPDCLIYPDVAIAFPPLR